MSEVGVTPFSLFNLFFDIESTNITIFFLMLDLYKTACSMVETASKLVAPGPSEMYWEKISHLILKILT